MVGRTLTKLTPESHATALELLELPDLIRGYEEIKLRNVVDVQEAGGGYREETRCREARA